MVVYLLVALQLCNGRYSAYLCQPNDEVVEPRLPVHSQNVMRLRITSLAARGRILVSHSSLALTPSSQGQGIAPREMAVSLMKWACVTIEAICALIAIALSHGDKRAVALVAVALFATIRFGHGPAADGSDFRVFCSPRNRQLSECKRGGTALFPAAGLHASWRRTRYLVRRHPGAGFLFLPWRRRMRPGRSRPSRPRQACLSKL
jgi:GNAT superfamily N-acetyltransferase